MQTTKGIILAGGMGTRLLPSSKVTNKHLLAVFDRPMIYYPIHTLKMLGISNILIISGGNNIGAFMELLNDGNRMGVAFTYKVQKDPSGIAGALKLAEDFVGSSNFYVILGDNIFDNSVVSLRSQDNIVGGEVILTASNYPERFGVAEFEEGTTGKRLLKIYEKPKTYAGKKAQIVTGLYKYSQEIFAMLHQLNKSGRGEFEITDLHNKLIQSERLSYKIFDGFWSDAGTHTSMLECGNFISQNQDKF